MTPDRDLEKYPSIDYEETLWKSGFTHIGGVDEAGRGAWAGPVCAAIVILPPDPSIINSLFEVRDSKLMTPISRVKWAPLICAAARAWGVGAASASEIDLFGIVPATKLAARRALDDISKKSISGLSNPNPIFSEPDYLLTDYLIFPTLEIPQTALIKGDRLSLSIAAASVLAKTARDEIMVEMDNKYPGYGFKRHKGYGTKMHQLAIHSMGLCEIHRKSFSII